MINYTKKWWLLGCHWRAELRYGSSGSNDGKNRVLITQSQFINGDAKHVGVANKYNPFVRFRFSHLIFWKKEYNEEKLKIKRLTYSSIYEVLVRERYITKDEETKYPTVSNPKAYNIRGFPFPYLNGFVKTYDKVSFAIGAFIIALIGSSFLTSWFTNKNDISQKPIINNITTPAVNPITNIYLNATTTK